MGLEQALPELLEKTCNADGRRWCGSASRRGRRTRARVWTHRDDSSLPHAPTTAGRQRQPILITTGFDHQQRRRALPGRTAPSLASWPVTPAASCCVDGADEAQLAVARVLEPGQGQRRFVSYWKQQARGWERQA
jgi:DNA polymerase-3 subunit chi